MKFGIQNIEFIFLYAILFLTCSHLFCIVIGQGIRIGKTLASGIY